MLAVIAFLVAEARGAHPIVPLELFRSRPVAVSVSVGFTFTIAFYGLVFLLSLYLQDVRGLSPLATGLAFVPMTGLTAFVTLVAPRAAARFGPRVPIALGQLLIVVGLLGVVVALALQARVKALTQAIPNARRRLGAGDGDDKNFGALRRIRRRGRCDLRA